ncbi:hypothetical protein AVEN_4331-1 [Araneus ventricosus]|uniref:Uncharacterized protein n=1 Tax=Araneus ventricosus TaxID=182803 RepID=A0A4Y2KY46_ARAVE|nr:hypothetical protein AVEN_4331-1 [Araneus ventricosus]
MSVFRDGYKLAFIPDQSLELKGFLFSTACYTLLIPLALMISALLTNEAKNKILAVMRKIFYKYSKDHFRFVSLETDSSQSTLTLWKIYVLDRSLTIACLAALLTYGILLGTLGK